MKCRHCGAELRDTVAFCYNCGMLVETEPEVEEIQAEVMEPEDDYEFSESALEESTNNGEVPDSVISFFEGLEESGVSEVRTPDSSEFIWLEEESVVPKSVKEESDDSPQKKTMLIPILIAAGVVLAVCVFFFLFLGGSRDLVIEISDAGTGEVVEVKDDVYVFPEYNSESCEYTVRCNGKPCVMKISGTDSGAADLSNGMITINRPGTLQVEVAENKVVSIIVPGTKLEVNGQYVRSGDPIIIKQYEDVRKTELRCYSYNTAGEAIGTVSSWSVDFESIAEQNRSNLAIDQEKSDEKTLRLSGEQIGVAYAVFKASEQQEAIKWPVVVCGMKDLSENESLTEGMQMDLSVRICAPEGEVTNAAWFSGDESVCALEGESVHTLEKDGSGVSDDVSERFWYQATQACKAVSEGSCTIGVLCQNFDEMKCQVTVSKKVEPAPVTKAGTGTGKGGTGITNGSSGKKSVGSGSKNNSGSKPAPKPTTSKSQKPTTVRPTPKPTPAPKPTPKPTPTPSSGGSNGSNDELL